MMAAKKNKFTQICFLKLENMEAGSGIRANLAYILFKTLAQMNNGMFNESKNAMSVMIKSIDDTHEDAIRTDNECVACIDYAGYYSKQELDIKVEKLVKLCEEKKCIFGPETVRRCTNKLAMESEVFIWEWEL